MIKMKVLDNTRHLIMTGTKSKREEIKATKHEGADKIYDKGGVVVYRTQQQEILIKH